MMRAEIEVNGSVTISFAEDAPGRFMIRWAIFWPEKQKNPSLALQLLQHGDEETVFSKELNKQGKEISLLLLDTILAKKYYHIVMPGKRQTDHLNRRHEISSLELIRQRVREHNPKE